MNLQILGSYYRLIELEWSGQAKDMESERLLKEELDAIDRSRKQQLQLKEEELHRRKEEEREMVQVGGQ